MNDISKEQFPLFHKLAGGLFPSIYDHVPVDKQPAYLLTFVQDHELAALVKELREILEKRMSDKEWEAYWYTSPASSFPIDALSTERLLAGLIEEAQRKMDRWN